jgi:hypothetical protein
VIEIWGRFDAAEKALDEWVDALTREPYDALLHLSLEGARPARPSNPQVEWMLNREVQDGGRLQVVAQAYRAGKALLFLRFGEMLAKGFWVDADGTVTMMPEEALLEFM